MEKLAFTVKEAAEAVGVSRPTIYEWMKIEGFPVARVGGCVRIPVRAFERWIEERSGVA